MNLEFSRHGAGIRDFGRLLLLLRFHPSPQLDVVVFVVFVFFALFALFALVLIVVSFVLFVVSSSPSKPRRRP